MKRIIDFLIRIYHKVLLLFGIIERKNIPAYSAYAAFFILIAFVPFTILLLAIVKHTPLSYGMVLTAFAQFVPESLFPFVSSIINEIYQYTGTAIISISAVTSLWSASKGAVALTKGLNNINNVAEHRNFIILRVVSGIYTFLLLVLIVLTLILMVFGSNIRDYLTIAIPFLSEPLNAIVSFRPLISLPILTLFFAALYRFLPDRHTTYKSQLPGAFLAAFGWLVFSYFYSVYMNYFSSYSYMYGSLTAIVLAMIWLYFCMFIFFMGGAVNVRLETKGFRKKSQKS